MRKELLMEGFEFSQKGSHGNTRVNADVSISLQKNTTVSGGGDEWKYGFAIRGGLYELILEKEEAIRLGLRGNMLYFIPTSREEGYAFHRYGKSDTVYACVCTSSLPSLQKFLTRGTRIHAELKFDKRLELYYVNLEEGVRNER